MYSSNILDVIPYFPVYLRYPCLRWSALEDTYLCHKYSIVMSAFWKIFI